MNTLLLAATSATLLVTWSERPTAPLQDSTLPAALGKVVVIGASVSDGFGLGSEFEGVEVDFGDFLGAALPAGSVVHEFGASQMFLDPVKFAETMVASAEELEPTLLVAADFVFWFAYGFVPSEETRLRSLETGLAYLDRFDCPMVVGNVPDMSRALEGVGPFGGPMIQPAQVPGPATLERINARIHEWAAAKGSQVTLLSLYDFVELAHGDEPIELRGNRWEGSEVTGFLQADLLHPTMAGTSALTVLTLDALADQLPEIERMATWSAGGILTKLREQHAEALEKASARQRRREELKRKRLEKANAGG